MKPTYATLPKIQQLKRLSIILRYCSTPGKLQDFARNYTAVTTFKIKYHNCDTCDALLSIPHKSSLLSMRETVLTSDQFINRRELHIIATLSIYGTCTTGWRYFDICKRSSVLETFHNISGMCSGPAWRMSSAPYDDTEFKVFMRRLGVLETYELFRSAPEKWQIWRWHCCSWYYWRGATIFVLSRQRRELCV